MGKSKNAYLLIWFSGFFGLGALVHLVRSILQFPLAVGIFEVPVSLSVVLAIVLGGLSIGLLYLGCKPSCCQKDESSSAAKKV
ncbi:MAG: hypothetical protein ACREH5_01615 [Candidatus Omnitrophota bacterium]